ncbi:hypothetical protein SAMN02745163_04160 [Clostridium cavendishii DSM 21758]|uniref:TATA-box binding n=1 Tax=Clostridium cavendishii DSM 21758 TaxID=1121302 RepID=A0A1M6U3C4_9CLOT|nr:hypothetical protein [Clostridium cavendishii]SHK63654.1 hypothetical protein SAMN02745163_04160 [Clostridium cavendishii DSM 21758]
MNKSMIFISLILILFSSGICTREGEEETDLYKKVFTNLSEVQENGVKIKYTSNKPINEELKKILKNYNENFLEAKLKKENDVVYYNDNIEKDDKRIKILASDEGQGTNIEIEMIQNTKHINIYNMKKELGKLVDDTSLKPQYFSYVKGKLKTEKQISDVNTMLKEKLIENGAIKFNSIPINSGITGVASNNKNLKLNYSISEYSGGKYLILGTPIIFTTY